MPPFDHLYAPFQVKYVPAWMPGAHFKRLAAQWHVHVSAMAYKPFAAVKEAMVSVYLGAKALHHLCLAGNRTCGTVRSCLHAIEVGG